MQWRESISTILEITVDQNIEKKRDVHIIKKGEIVPKTKKFGCVGRGDLTFLFKSCEIYESQGRLI